MELRRESEAVGAMTDLGFNQIGSELFVAKLCGGTSGSDVVCF